MCGFCTFFFFHFLHSTWVFRGGKKNVKNVPLHSAFIINGRVSKSAEYTHMCVCVLNRVTRWNNNVLDAVARKTAFYPITFLFIGFFPSARRFSKADDMFVLSVRENSVYHQLIACESIRSFEIATGLNFVFFFVLNHGTCRGGESSEAGWGRVGGGGWVVTCFLFRACKRRRNTAIEKYIPRRSIEKHRWKKNWFRFSKNHTISTFRNAWRVL